MDANTSLSARRAWIEIRALQNLHTAVSVALRKESVDRNLMTAGDVTAPSASLSARRAWIEIPHAAYAGNTLLGRSPQGERG